MGNKNSETTPVTKQSIEGEAAIQRPEQDDVNKEGGQGEIPKQQVQKQSIKHIDEVKNSFVKERQVLNSKLNVSAIDQSKMVITHPKEKPFGLDSQILLVPFNVIVEKMQKQLRQIFKAHPRAKPIYEDYLQKDMFDKQWKLHGNGFFINYEEGFYICLITDTAVYKGASEVDSNNNIYPDVKGTLITKKGIYEGEFKKGKAHGKGKYLDIQAKAEYDGEWEDGLMMHGKIENSQFKFKGDLKKGLADGMGAVKFKKTLSTYVGGFSKGLYCDRKAKYNTKGYYYIGQFQNGLKQGNGRLIERKRDHVNKRMKYRPAEMFEGKYMDDYYVTNRIERDKKRLTEDQDRQFFQTLFGAAFNDANRSQNDQVSEFQQLYQTSRINIPAKKNESEKNHKREKNGKEKMASAPTTEEVVIPQYMQEEDAFDQDF